MTIYNIIFGIIFSFISGLLFYYYLKKRKNPKDVMDRFQLTTIWIAWFSVLILFTEPILRDYGPVVKDFITGMEWSGKTFANIILGIVGVSAIRITQTGSPEIQKWASVLGLLGQPAWFYVAWSDQNWGIFILCIFYTEAWIRGFKKHWIDKTKLTVN